MTTKNSPCGRWLALEAWRQDMVESGKFFSAACSSTTYIHHLCESLPKPMVGTPVQNLRRKNAYVRGHFLWTLPGQMNCPGWCTSFSVTKVSYYYNNRQKGQDKQWRQQTSNEIKRSGDTAHQSNHKQTSPPTIKQTKHCNRCTTTSSLSQWKSN